MRHVFECPMRWADLDQQGHVNNVVLVDYLQEARVDLLRSHGRSPGGEAEPLAEGVVVVRHEVTYLAPLALRYRPVKVECWVTELRAASFTLAYEVFHDDGPGERTVYLRASSVLTPYRFDVGRPRRLTDAERDRLAAYLEPAERPRPARPAPVPRTDLGHYPVQVRFSDVDVYRHVNNVRYVEYFQEARLRVLSRLWRHLPADVPPPAVVVAQTDIDYRAPISLRPEPYDSWTAVTHVGGRSVVVASEVRDGETLLATARVVLVFFDTATQRAATPHPAVREAMLAGLGEGG